MEVKCVVSSPRPYDYIAYIDEAGDPGLRFVKPMDPKGSSEWFMLAAVVIAANREEDTVDWVTDIVIDIESKKRSLHYRNFRPHMKMGICRNMAKLKARYFVVAFNKKNMRRHTNLFAERRAELLVGAPQNAFWLYRWAIRVLLEKVSAYVRRKSMRQHGEPRKVKLEFSENGGLRYDEIKEYLRLLRQHSMQGTQFLSYGDIDWSAIDIDLLDSFPNDERAGLQLADTVASAFFDACDIQRNGACFNLPAKALRPRVARKLTGVYAGYGVKLMPNWKTAKLRDDQAEIFRFYGYGPRT
jgi:hypothetical protein